VPFVVRALRRIPAKVFRRTTKSPTRYHFATPYTSRLP
jgi:hypothetical protein